MDQGDSRVRLAVLCALFKTDLFSRQLLWTATYKVLNYDDYTNYQFLNHQAYYHSPLIKFITGRGEERLLRRLVGSVAKVAGYPHLVGKYEEEIDEETKIYREPVPEEIRVLYSQDKERWIRAYADVEYDRENLCDILMFFDRENREIKEYSDFRVHIEYNYLSESILAAKFEVLKQIRTAMFEPVNFCPHDLDHPRECKWCQEENEPQRRKSETFWKEVDRLSSARTSMRVIRETSGIVVKETNLGMITYFCLGLGFGFVILEELVRVGCFDCV